MKDLNKRDEEDIIKELKHLVSDATYVIQSTLNQAVNYIPAKIIGFQDIINITVSDSLRFDNKKWDTCLKNKLKDAKFDDLEVTQSEVNNIECIKSKLTAKIKDKKEIFWNITGGQRPFIMAIYQIISETKDKKEHFICYLEGNKGQMIVSDKNFKKIFAEDYSLAIHDKDFNITTALNLMCFDTKELESTRKKEDIFSEPIEKDFIKQVTEKYLNEENFRNELIASKGEKTKFEAALSFYKGNFNYKNYHGNSRQKFGYLLEDMTTYLIYQDQNVWSKILDIRTSAKLFKQDNSTEIIDEFDILVLNKFGQIINFECKSGGMTGDVAKSTNYSTYAISGVYGKPVLITPLLQSDLTNSNYCNDEKIKSAIKAAKRSNLECWGINKISDNLKKYL